MLMRHFLMLKMFLSAAGTSVVVLHVLPLVSGRGRERVQAKTVSATSGLAETRGVPTIAAGAACIGIGMAITGSWSAQTHTHAQGNTRARRTNRASMKPHVLRQTKEKELVRLPLTALLFVCCCSALALFVSACFVCVSPGTVFAQIAAGSRTAWWIVLGGVLAGGLQPLLDLVPGWKGLVRSGGRRFQAWTLPQFLGAANPTAVALAVASVFATTVAALEWAAPWTSELAVLSSQSSSSAAMAAGAATGAGAAAGAGGFAIPPYMAGLVVGGLQLPLLMLLNSQLGCSGSYVTLASSLVGCLGGGGFASRVPGFCAARQSYFQVLLMAGVVLGSFTASTLSAATYHSDAMGLVSPAQGLLGGFLMVLGARVAGGCTSGHGISGMGYLALNSVVAVASMFGAGILTSFMFYR